jgi:glyoxylase-like metal-dependent hydrolase (beta-lactamase superfamily II)
VTVTFSRRDMIISAATAGAVFGLDKRFTILGASPAAAATAIEYGFYNFKVGDVEMTAIYDGEWAKDHDPGFIKDVSVEDTKKALVAAGLPDDKVRISFSVMVAKIGGKTVMFDAGTGGQVAPTAGLMMSKGLAAAGFDAAKIDAVVVTHIHPDHVFGLLSKDNAPVFPNAEVIVNAKEHAFWTDAALAGKMPEGMKGMIDRQQQVFAGLKNVRKIDDGAEVLPGLKAVATNGHTPGHTSYQLASGKDVLYILGDVSNIPALFLKHPNWHVQFDMDGAMAEKGRRAIMDRAISEGAMIMGYHYPFPAAGKVVKDGDGYTFTPVA